MFLRIITIFLIISSTGAFYSENSTIVSLNSSNFLKLVELSNEIWLVEYFAPWCGHCQEFSGEYKKIGNVLDGIVKVGAVNADDNHLLIREHGIQVYPTIKIYSDGKIPKDYQGERTANGLVNYIVTIIQQTIHARLNEKDVVFKSKNVKALTDKNFDKSVLASKEPWLVVFYSPACSNCRKLENNWENIVRGLKNSIQIGAIDISLHTLKSSELNIYKHPTILFFAGGEKKTTSGVQYLGKLSTDDIVAWASNKLLETGPAPDVVQIVNFESLEKACDKKTVCVVTFLPHILDCQSECRNEYLNALKNASLSFKGWPWGWVWSEANAQPDLEDALQMGGSGYPTMAVVSINKMKYSVLVGPFSYGGIRTFLKDLLHEKGNSKVITRDEMPVVYDVTPWDGLDVKEPTSDEPFEDETLDEIFKDEF